MTDLCEWWIIEADELGQEDLDEAIEHHLDHAWPDRPETLEATLWREMETQDPEWQEEHPDQVEGRCVETRTIDVEEWCREHGYHPEEAQL